MRSSQEKLLPPSHLLKIKNAGFETIKDLLSILPLRIQPTPKISPFTSMREGELFLGKGKIIGSNFAPAFGRRGKGKAQLFNVSLTVQDELSEELLTIKIFNAYPNIKKSVESKDSSPFLANHLPLKAACK